MNYYLIKFHYYLYLGDGEHDSGTMKRLVRAKSFKKACKKIIKAHKDLMLNQFMNLTIE